FRPLMSVRIRRPLDLGNRFPYQNAGTRRIGVGAERKKDGTLAQVQLREHVTDVIRLYVKDRHEIVFHLLTAALHRARLVSCRAYDARNTKDIGNVLVLIPSFVGFGSAFLGSCHHDVSIGPWQWCTSRTGL